MCSSVLASPGTVGPPRGEAEVLNGAAQLEEMLGLAHKTPLDPISPKEA